MNKFEDYQENIFKGHNIENIKKGKIRNLILYMEKKDSEYILNINKDLFFAYLKEKFLFKKDELVLNLDEIEAERLEMNIPKNQFKHADLFPNNDKYYKVEVLIVNIPFEGQYNYFNFSPNSRCGYYPKGKILNNELSYLIRIDNTEDLQEEIERTNQHIQKWVNNFNKELYEYNKTINSYIEEKFNELFTKYNHNNQQLNNISIPIIQKSNNKKTFEVDILKEKKIEIKMSKPSTKYEKPTPVITDDNYLSILSSIHQYVKSMERYPSIYKDKDEEDIRDLLLMTLSNSFCGEASGETFNKEGKTDILLSYQKENVFVMELKFWRGEKSFLKTIDQLLGYLTWRDSKSSILILVKNKDVEKVISKAKITIKTHNNYIKYNGGKNETWLNYDFFLKNDNSRKFKLALMFFNIES